MQRVGWSCLGSLAVDMCQQISTSPVRRNVHVHGECWCKLKTYAAAEQRDELAPSYSITSSASESKLSEILTPSAFAVLMLITSSNLTTCCTGKSAGFVPLRILAA